MGVTVDRAACSASAWLIRGAIIVLVAAYVGTSASPTHVACAIKSFVVRQPGVGHKVIGDAHARIDRLISFAMWVIIAMAVPVMAMLAQDRSFKVVLALDDGAAPWSGFLRRSASRMRTGRQALNRRGSTASPS